MSAKWMVQPAQQTRHIYTMFNQCLAHRLRRWPNIGQTLGRCVGVCWVWQNALFTSQKTLTLKTYTPDVSARSLLKPTAQLAARPMGVPSWYWPFRPDVEPPLSLSS